MNFIEDISTKHLSNLDSPAIITNENNLTYRELIKEVKKTAASLIELNIHRMKPVAVLSDNNKDFIILVLALWMIDAVPAPINTRLTQKEVEELINISDIIVYPTLDMNEKQEIPMILLESLAMEKPIIITDIPPLNEILKSNCGIKIGKGDFYKLSQEILNLKNNKKRRLKIGKNGRKMVVKYFNIIKIAREYEKLYSSI